MLQVEPATLSFAAGQPYGRQQLLRVWSKKPHFKLSRVRVLDGPFAAALDPPESSTVFKVRVTWNGPPSEKDIEADGGKLELISNDPIEPKKLVELRNSRFQIPAPPPPPRPPGVAR